MIIMTYQIIGGMLLTMKFSIATLTLLASMNEIIIMTILRCCHLSHARPLGARRLMVTDIFTIATHGATERVWVIFGNSGTLKFQALSKTRRNISAVIVVLMKVPI
jgi:hypothetical protein